MAVTNLILSIATFALREDNFKEHEHTLLVNDIWAIAAIKTSWRHGQLNISSEAIFTGIFQLCINTLTSDTITLEEETLGYLGGRDYNNYLLGMNGKHVKIIKLITLSFKECLENPLILIEY